MTNSPTKNSIQRPNWIIPEGAENRIIVKTVKNSIILEAVQNRVILGTTKNRTHFESNHQSKIILKTIGNWSNDFENG